MGFEPFLAYEASAGSGKTFNLVVRYLSLLFMGEDPKSITALTFTNKAANEMMERVTLTLQELETRGELESISRVSGLDKEDILNRRNEVLARFLRSDIQISTIDAFFGTILRKFALNAGIMPTFKTTQNHHEVKLMERFLRQIEVSHHEDALVRLSLLSDKRLADLFTLLEGLYSKHKELDSLTLSDEPNNVPSYDKVMEVANTLSTLVRSKPLSERSDKTMRFDHYEELLSKTWLTKPSLNYWDFQKSFEPRMDELLHEIQSLIKVQMRQKEARYFKELFTILKLYIASRHSLILQNNELSFDDITLMVHALLREKLESEFLYFRLDSRLKHLLLDEFQDTSMVQFDIIRPLIEEIFAGEGVNRGGSFFFVGDVKQSIYRFRGGFSGLFYEVARHFHVHVEPLRVNYRSHTLIVDFVNDIFGDKIQGYIHQESPASLSGGEVSVLVGDEPLMELGQRVAALVAQGIACEEIAILAATNKDGSAIEEHLVGLGYEVVTETTAKLIHQSSVRAMIAYMQYCFFGAPLYQYNCAALMGVDPHNIVRVPCDDIVKMAVQFVADFKIADKSALMFLENLRHFRDCEEAVFEVERLEASAPQSDLHGIRVMTVHKSKGLEFEHVIVCDRLGIARSRGDAVVFEYEGLHLEKLHYRIKGREFLDEDYARALDKDKELEKQDQLNALYVALTRAVKSLCVVAKTKSSWFEPLELVQSSLGHLEKSVSRIEPKKDLEEPMWNIQSYGYQDEKGSSSKETAHNYAAIEFGIALHYTLEMMGSFEQSAVENALESMRNRHGATLEEEAIRDIQQRVRRLIGDEQFEQLTRGECFREQMIRHNGSLGIIDLLVQYENGWVIIDYKSGRDGEEKHREQVQWYVNALRAFGYDEVCGYLCYVLEEQIQWQKVA